MDAVSCTPLASPTDSARFGFAYGTLTNHAESGEELFEVFLDPQRATSSTGFARFVAAGRAGARRPTDRAALQARFRRDSAEAMLRATRALR